jgi:outer membrane receptor protein involved in Fe transport
VRDNVVSGAILMTNYGAALDAVTLNGQLVCADPVARAAGCVPINIFGFNTVTPEAARWLSTYTGRGVVIPGLTPGEMVTDTFARKSYQDVASLSLTGNLFNLPAGPVGVALGVEYHAERAAQSYDPATASGFSSAQLASDTIGKYHSKEAFVELNVPLLSGRPFAEELSLQGAARYADYTTVGGVWSYKVGGTYAPSRDIRFRAIFARAVRAPNINELYQNPASTAPQVIDPCDQNEGNGDIAAGGSPSLATLPAGCATIPGIATYLQTHPYFAYSLAQIQTTVGFLGGNRNLTAEATNTFTAGMTFTPTFLRGFYITADYYRIKVNNAIAAVDQQTSVDQCFLTGAPEFCNSVTRNANGFITQVDALNINAASYLVAGLDVQAQYSVPLRTFNQDGKFTLGVFYNHKFKQEQTPFVGGPVSNELGTADSYSSNQLGTGFKDQFTLNANLQTGPVSVAYVMRYLGPVTASSGDFHINAYTYHDLQLRFAVGEQRKFEFYVGVNNLTDKQPPFIESGNSQWPGTNTVADTYDLFGRMLYAGFTTRF